MKDKEMDKYCIVATTDTGLIDEVVTLATARNNIPMGWHILPGTVTENRQDAEKALKKWKRRPRKLMRQLERLIQ